ncbi:hypothetical protein GFS60_07873 (plasmid) [Rhodococcus sp. WAY2]|nr:hypothetical protein GFS60_07873 [Rhodococcus sp. WAY2]
MRNGCFTTRPVTEVAASRKLNILEYAERAGDDGGARSGTPHGCGRG